MYHIYPEDLNKFYEPRIKFTLMNFIPVYGKSECRKTVGFEESVNK